MPAIPDAGSTKPVCATSRCLTPIDPWNGVSATSFRLNGPASPSTLTDPPAGAFADTENGNADTNERFETVTSTASYERPVRLLSRPRIEICPPAILIFRSEEHMSELQSHSFISY